MALRLGSLRADFLQNMPGRWRRSVQGFLSRRPGVA